MPTNYIPRPIPGASNGAQSDLEYAAIIQRNTLIPTNTYNNVAQSNQYGITHTRAITDSLTPNAGRGTGNYLDVNNYSAGIQYDIIGNPSQGTVVGAGVGRTAMMSLNNATWGYGPTGLNLQNYDTPNTSLNSGQVII